MKKILFIVFMVLFFPSCAAQDIKESSNSHNISPSNQINTSNSAEIDISLNNNSIFTESLESDFELSISTVYDFSETVKGELQLTSASDEKIPRELLDILQTSLYLSCGENPESIINHSNSENIEFFKTLKLLGSEDYVLQLSKIYELFPSLLKEDFVSEYEAYQFLANSENCTNIFYYNFSERDFFVFANSMGASNGTYLIEFKEFVNSEFILISAFQTQNYGFASVIAYKEEFYYVFLQYNYNLKNYDGIRIYKLEEATIEKNILIQFLPKEFVKKTVYSINDSDYTDVLSYTDSIINLMNADFFIENGSGMDIDIYSEDEVKDEIFENCYKIDFTNGNNSIFIERSFYTPSNYRTTSHLRANFYYLDDTGNLTSIEPWTMDKYNGKGEYSFGNELIQLWYKKFKGKIYIFSLYHISDYNYFLDVTLVENNEITRIRADVFSPTRYFELIENQIIINN